MVVGLTRVRKHGRAVYLLMTPEMRDQTGWQPGDYITVRPVGEKLLLERVQLEQLAKLQNREATDDNTQTRGR